jgi:hypothetical protein
VAPSPRVSLAPLETQAIHDWVLSTFPKWSPELQSTAEKALLERGFFTSVQLAAFQDIDMEEIAIELEMKDFTAKLFLAKAAVLSTAIPPPPPDSPPVFVATVNPARLGSLDKHDSLWESDAARSVCKECDKAFGLMRRRHHCRTCGLLVCHECSGQPTAVDAERDSQLDENIHCKSCILAVKKADAQYKNETKLARLVAEFSANEAGVPRKSLIESLVMLGPALFKNSEHQLVVGSLHEWVLNMPQDFSRAASNS